MPESKAKKQNAICKDILQIVNKPQIALFLLLVLPFYNFSIIFVKIIKVFQICAVIHNIGGMNFLITQNRIAPFDKEN